MKTFEELVASIRKNISFSREQIEELGQIINQFDPQRFTPLMRACQSGNVPAVKSLLSAPLLDIHLNNGPPNYETALMIAANSVHPEAAAIVKKLIQHPAIVQKDINRALIYFSRQGDLAGVQTCLEKKAEVNATYLHNTALTEATFYEQVEVVNHLLLIPGIDINYTNYRDETPLIIALYKKKREAYSAFTNQAGPSLRTRAKIADW